MSPASVAAVGPRLPVLLDTLLLTPKSLVFIGLFLLTFYLGLVMIMLLIGHANRHTYRQIIGE